MTQNRQQVRVQFIAPFLIITLLMLIAWTLTQWAIINRMIQSQRGEFVAHFTAEWRSVTDATAKAQENLLYQISHNTRLIDAFLAQDRNAMLAKAKPLLDYYRQSAGINHFYFHQPDGTNFLRVHLPDRHGDQIKRKTLTQAMTNKDTASGIEVSIYGRTLLRTVQPWYHDDKLIGYLELGTTMQHLLDWISGTQNAGVALIVSKQFINQSQWELAESPQSKERWNQYDNYLLEAVVGNTPPKDLMVYFDAPETGPIMDKNQIARLRGQIAFTDMEDRVIGHLLIEKDFAWLVSDFSQVLKNVILIFVALIALTTLLYAFFAKRLNDRLSFSYRALNTEIDSRKAAEASLIEHQKSLEEAVAKRTKELNSANRELKADIELREQTERLLAESTQKYRALFNGSTDMIFVMRGNKLIDANVAAHSAFDFQHIGRKNLSLDSVLECQESTPTNTSQWLREARENGVFRAEMEFNGQHQRFPVEVMITYINEDNSSLFLIACRDISERKAAQAKVEYQALYDPLTDLPNRRLFMEELQRALQLCRRQNKKGAILFIDLDHFKNINDTLGHSVGDELLEQVAHRLKHSVRGEDTVARFGGDEFVVILPCCGDSNHDTAQNAHSTAKKISAFISDTYVIGEHQLHVTPSVGIALFPKLNESTEDILKQADAALYGAKGDGRNTIRFFEPKMQQANEERLVIEKELRKALQLEQMYITLQTKHNAKGEVIGSECLLRWKHPELGMVSPFHFISIAEESGYIGSIGLWVFEQVTHWISHCRNLGLPDSYSKVAVNLSPLQLFQPNFVNDIWGLVQKYQISPEQITLEITENVLIKDFDQVVKLLQKLKDLGFMISVDDFGTGYSSLRYLKSLPIDELKIDQSFVRDIHTNSNDRAIADTIISMARHLSLTVVAEGVENQEQFSLLKQQGCERFQGYYFARPITTGELIDKIKATA